MKYMTLHSTFYIIFRSKFGLNAKDILTLNDLVEDEREASTGLFAPIGLPLAKAGKFATIGGLLTLNPLLKGTGLITKIAGKKLIVL